MGLIMASQVTSPVIQTGIFEFQLTSGCWNNPAGPCPEIYKVAVVRRVALGVTDPMGIMTGVAGSVFVNNVFLVVRERGAPFRNYL